MVKDSFSAYTHRTLVEEHILYANFVHVVSMLTGSERPNPILFANKFEYMCVLCTIYFKQVVTSSERQFMSYIGP